jgi:hypothetical protein
MQQSVFATFTSYCCVLSGRAAISLYYFYFLLLRAQWKNINQFLLLLLLNVAYLAEEQQSVFATFTSQCCVLSGGTAISLCYFYFLMLRA